MLTLEIVPDLRPCVVMEALRVRLEPMAADRSNYLRHAVSTMKLLASVIRDIDLVGQHGTSRGRWLISSLTVDE